MTITIYYNSFEDCVFCGSINASAYGCGFIGWGSLTDQDYSISFTNCASVGRFSGNGTYHPLGYEFA